MAKIVTKDGGVIETDNPTYIKKLVSEGGGIVESSPVTYARVEPSTRRKSEENIEEMNKPKTVEVAIPEKPAPTGQTYVIGEKGTPVLFKGTPEQVKASGRVEVPKQQLTYGTYTEYIRGSAPPPQKKELTPTTYSIRNVESSQNKIEVIPKGAKILYNKPTPYAPTYNPKYGGAVSGTKIIRETLFSDYPTGLKNVASGILEYGESGARAILTYEPKKLKEESQHQTMGEYMQEKWKTPSEVGYSYTVEPSYKKGYKTARNIELIGLGYSLSKTGYKIAKAKLTTKTGYNVQSQVSLFKNKGGAGYKISYVDDVDEPVKTLFVPKTVDGKQKIYSLTYTSDDVYFGITGVQQGKGGVLSETITQGVRSSDKYYSIGGTTQAKKIVETPNVYDFTTGIVEKAGRTQVPVKDVLVSGGQVKKFNVVDEFITSKELITETTKTPTGILKETRPIDVLKTRPKLEQIGLEKTFFETAKVRTVDVSPKIVIEKELVGRLPAKTIKDIYKTPQTKTVIDDILTPSTTKTAQKIVPEAISTIDKVGINSIIQSAGKPSTSVAPSLILGKSLINKGVAYETDDYQILTSNRQTPPANKINTPISNKIIRGSSKETSINTIINKQVSFNAPKLDFGQLFKQTQGTKTTTKTTQKPNTDIINIVKPAQKPNQIIKPITKPATSTKTTTKTTTAKNLITPSITPFTGLSIVDILPPLKPPKSPKRDRSLFRKRSSNKNKRGDSFGYSPSIFTNIFLPLRSSKGIKKLSEPTYTGLEQRPLPKRKKRKKKQMKDVFSLF